jgi:type I restriction enzyme S subunit
VTSEALGNLLVRRRNEVEIEADTLHRQVRVRLHYKGAVLRDEVPGSEIEGARYRVEPGQLVLSRIDARHGAIAIVPPELDGAIVSNDFWVFDLRDDVEADYIHHFFQTLQFREACNRASAGSTNRRRLREEAFNEIRLPLPANRSDQLALVARIDDEVGLVEEAQSRARSLIALAEEAYPAAVRQMITTFDADGPEREFEEIFEALKSAAPPAFRANNAKPGVSEEVAGPFETAPGWRWASLGALCTHIVDCVNDTPEFTERATGYLGLKTSNVRANRLVLDELWHVTREDFDAWNRRLAPQEDDLILTREAPMGFVARVPSDLKICLTQRLVLLRTEPSAVLPGFLAHVLNDWLLLDQAKALSKSQPPHLRVRDIPRLAVPICGRAAQAHVTEVLDGAFDSATAIGRRAQEQLTELDAVRRSIFSSAFAGVRTA